MPMHDWTRVNAGIFHAFHHEWISELSRALNRGLLPTEYDALPEQVAAGFGPDVLTLQELEPPERDSAGPAAPSGGTMLRERPRTRFMAETDAEFYRRKKSSIAIRHVSGDRIVAMVEIISPGNKATRAALQTFVDKACELLENRIHLLIIDPFPPGRRDPQGIHASIWAAVSDDGFELPPEKPLTLVSYECGLTTRAWIDPIAVGDSLPDMPLFLDPEVHIRLPLEASYLAAFDALPLRWRRVLGSDISTKPS